MKKLIFLIFILACFIRFQFYPENIYFGYDQARDAFESQNIYKNLDLKIVGPSTAAQNLFHGPLYWYLIGPFYILGDGNPNFAAAFLLFLNALGVFFIFAIGKTVFNNKVGILAAFIFAVSFEQTQYALYFGNPAPAVITVMLFYLGLSFFIFKKNWLGLPIALVGLGLSVQFEFFLVYLFVVLLIYATLFRRYIKVIFNTKLILISISAILLTLSTFILAEIKFDFRTTNNLIGIVTNVGASGENLSYTSGLYFEKLFGHVKDNIFFWESKILFFILILSAFYLVLRKKSEVPQILFILVWIFSSALLLIFGLSNLYYTNIGISVAFILLSSFFIEKMFRKSLVVGLSIMVLILFSNVKLVVNQNHNGIINGIYVQEGMLLSREKQVIDYIYRESQGKPIVVSALTMPLKINTTWAYLFNWYGKDKYGYLPYWAGEAALGYPGSLPIWKSQEKDYLMFNIIEPTRGVRPAFIENFLVEQEQYGKVTDEKTFGQKPYAQLKIQKRAN